MGIGVQAIRPTPDGFVHIMAGEEREGGFSQRKAKPAALDEAGKDTILNSGAGPAAPAVSLSNSVERCCGLSAHNDRSIQSFRFEIPGTVTQGILIFHYCRDCQLMLNYEQFINHSGRGHPCDS
jgi:hypothetical protein